MIFAWDEAKDRSNIHHEEGDQYEKALQDGLEAN